MCTARVKRANDDVLRIFITFISDDDHRNLQIEVTLAPALRCTLGRAYFSFQDRFTQSDGLLERFSTIQTEHHHEQVSCEWKKKKIKKNCGFDLHLYFLFLFSIIPQNYFARMKDKEGKIDGLRNKW